MNLQLNSLISDARLNDIFGGVERHSIVQVWLLDYRSDNQSKVSWIYGRVVPSDYSSNNWRGKVSVKYQSLASQDSFRVLQITASTSGDVIKKFTERLAEGDSIFDASAAAGIELDKKLASVVGGATLAPLICIRPVMHLPARNYYKLFSQRLSPSSQVSYDSGAISALNKASLFSSFGKYAAVEIVNKVCSSLNAATGIDFSRSDSWRLGDFELLCAPSLNSSGRCKYSATEVDGFFKIEISESFSLQPKKMMVLAKSFSGDCLQDSHVCFIEKDAKYPLTVKIASGFFKNEMATATSLEVYALSDSDTQAELCLQVARHHPRQMTTDLHIKQETRLESENKWFSDQVSQKEKSRLKQSQEIFRASPRTRFHTSAGELDPWVDANAECARKVAGLLPEKSSARFFPKLSYSKGEGRLGIVSWLREIFELYPNCQIAWFDPFMEDVGIDLINRLGSNAGNYLIFTSDKKSNDDDEAGESDGEVSLRIKKLHDKCREWGASSFGNVNLKVIVLPGKKLHDRMLIVRSKVGYPIAGYHLSNSIQRAAAHHPYLITEVSKDILQDVARYMDEVINGSMQVSSEGSQDGGVIFDSSKLSGNNTLSEYVWPSLFDMPRIGDVVAWWLEMEELQGLRGDSLIKKCEEVGIAKEGCPSHSRFGDIPSKMWVEGFNLEFFHSAWDAMGHLLGYLPAGETFNMGDWPLATALQDKLISHLEPYRKNSLPPRRAPSVGLDIDYYCAQKLESLLLNEGPPYRIFSYQPPEVDCADWYAISILWLKSPEGASNWLSKLLVEWVKGDKDWSSGRIRHRALIVSTLRHLCNGPYHGCRLKRLKTLLASDVPLLQWIGLDDLKRNLRNGDVELSSLGLLMRFPQDEHVRILCWLLSETDPNNSRVFRAYIEQLIDVLSGFVSGKELSAIIKIFQYRHNRKNLTPLILEFVLLPLLDKKIVTTGQVATFWFDQLIDIWAGKTDISYMSFSGRHEGVFTEELSMLFSCSSEKEQSEIVRKIKNSHSELARTIRLPLSVQVNSSNFRRAHKANVWIYSVARLCAEFASGDVKEELVEILNESSGLTQKISAVHRESIVGRELIDFASAGAERLNSHHLLSKMKEINAKT